MSCIAQICPLPVPVTCPEPVDCDPFVIAPNCIINMVEVDCCILKGTVECGTGTPSPVPGAIVFATQSGTGDVFAGVTNAAGVYCICVEPGDYELECYCCGEDCCEDADCNCACS